MIDQDGRQRLEGDLEQGMHATMESVNWVCGDLFKEEHEWVTQLTLSESEGLILADLEYNLDVPCVMQWALLWFTAPPPSNCTTRRMGYQKICSTKRKTLPLNGPAGNDTGVLHYSSYPNWGSDDSDGTFGRRALGH